MRSPIWSPHTAMLSASAAKLRFAGGYAGIAVSCRVGGLQGRLCGPGFPVGGMALVACIQDAWLAVAWAAAVYLEQRGAGEQVAELGIAVVAGIEVRALLGDDVTHGRERGPAVVVRGRLHGIAQLVHQRGVAFELSRCGGLSRTAWCRGGASGAWAPGSGGNGSRGTGG